MKKCELPPVHDGGSPSLREISALGLHHSNSGFINPFSKTVHGNPIDILRWKLLGKNRNRHLYNKEKTIPVSIDWGARCPRPRLTFISHATILIEDASRSILVDPVLYGLPWPIRNFTPLSFTPDDMPCPDMILITHGHYDHLDTRSLCTWAKRSHIITPLGYTRTLKGIQPSRHTELDWFESVKSGDTTITLLPCDHWSMRNPLRGANTSLWGSYIIRTSEGKTIYVSGDTAYFEEIDQIGNEFEIDLAVFNLGAYEPRWFMKRAHMNPPEVIEAFRRINAKKLMITHWGTFRLGDDPVYAPPLDLQTELKATDLTDRLVEIAHGQTISL